MSDIFKLNLSKAILAANGKPAKIADEPGKEREATVRDLLLTLMSAQAGLSGKETFLLTKMALQISDESLSEVEVHPKRLDLLRKIIKENKGHQGQPIIGSLVQGQLFEAVGLGEDDL